MSNEVYIDGCNVAECDCYDNTFCLWSKKYYERRFTPKCEIVKDCYFKQLQRAKAETKNINIAYMNLVQEIIAGIFYAGEIRPDNLTPLDVLRNIKKENKDLKAENDTLHITISKLKADLSQAESSLYAWKAENEKLKNRNKLYKKIIKENIEKANNNFMILTACIQGNLTVDEVKEYAKLNAKNDELKAENEKLKKELDKYRQVD